MTSARGVNGRCKDFGHWGWIVALAIGLTMITSGFALMRDGAHERQIAREPAAAVTAAVK